MKKTEVALQTRDGNEALRYSGKDRALIIYLQRASEASELTLRS